MTAHELARKLLDGPDLPVIINGWGSDEGISFEVTRLGDPTPADYAGPDNTIRRDISARVITLEYDS